MGRHKKTRVTEPRTEASSTYSSNSSTESLPQTQRVEIRFKRMLSERKEKSKRRKKTPSTTQPLEYNTNNSVDRTNSRTSYYHQHYHHHHYHVDAPERSDSGDTTTSSFSNRPANYREVEAYPQYHRTRSSKRNSRNSYGSNYAKSTHAQPALSTSPKLTQSPSITRQGRFDNAASPIPHDNASSRQSSVHESRQRPLQKRASSQRSSNIVPHRVSTSRRTRDIPHTQSLIRTSTTGGPSTAKPTGTQRPRRIVHTVASLERLNQLEFGSPALMIRRKPTMARRNGTPIRRFFLRIFRRRTRAKFYYTKAQLRKNISLSAPAADPRYHQYSVRPIQLFSLRPKPRIPSVRKPSNIQISQPIQVTKHAGIDSTGRGEVLSIRNPIRNRRSSSMIRVKIPPDSPLARQGHMVQAPPRPGSSVRSNAEYDFIDERLDRLQQELDETRRMKRRLSQRKDSLSSSSNSLRHRVSRASLARERSFISLTSTVLPTLDDHPDIIRRSDLYKRKSLKSDLGHMPVPPSSSKISRMDIDSAQDPEKVDEALAFVNTWAEYLRRAIAVRILLRQEIKSHEYQEEQEWEKLQAVEEEEASSYIGESDSVRSFGSDSSNSKGSQSITRTSDMMGLSAAKNSRFADSPRDTTSRGYGGGGGGTSSSTSDGTRYRVARLPYMSPASARVPSYLRGGNTSGTSSIYSTAEENFVHDDGEIFYNDNGEMISITPVSTIAQGSVLSLTPADTSNTRAVASSIRQALRQGQMHEKYAALMGSGQRSFSASAIVSQSTGERSRLVPLAEQRVSRGNSQKSDSSKDSYGSFGKPGKESVWMRSSSSSGKSSFKSQPRPLPPLPGSHSKRIVSAPVRSLMTVPTDDNTSPQQSSSSSNSPGASVDDTIERSSRPLAIPQLLQDQREMGDKILADMVQEMKELQARSLALSDLAKNHRDISESENQENVYQTPTNSSSSEFSVFPVHKPQGIPSAKSHYYVLGSPKGSGTNVARNDPTVAGSSSSQQLSSNRSLPRLASVPRLQTGDSLSSGSSGSLPHIPRKISRAESIAAAASVNLSRGGQNRRRPRSEVSSRRSSQRSSFSGTYSNNSDNDYQEAFADLSAPPAMVATIGSSGSSRQGSTDSNDRLTTTWVTMDMTNHH